MKNSKLRTQLVSVSGCFGLKRTFLIGTSLFALSMSASAQMGTTQEFETYKYNWQQVHGLQQLTSEQYNQMKLDYIQYQLEVPEDQEKAEAYLLERGLPAGFPVKVYTGNPDLDEANYQSAKDTWIMNNQELYDQMMSEGKPTPAQLLEREITIKNQNQNQNN